MACDLDLVARFLVVDLAGILSGRGGQGWVVGDGDDVHLVIIEDRGRGKAANWMWVGSAQTKAKSATRSDRERNSSFQDKHAIVLAGDLILSEGNSV